MNSGIKVVALPVWRAIYRAARPLQLSRLSRRSSEGLPIRLTIGSGHTSLPGWTETDLTPRWNGLPGRKPKADDRTAPTADREGHSVVMFMDATKPFPFPTGSVSRIRSEHMIEHISYADGQRMLAECARVLEPGGRIRIATPDFGVFVQLGMCDVDGSEPTPDQRRYVEGSNKRNGLDPCDSGNVVVAVNRMFSGHGHRCIYSKALLFEALERAGFVNCVVSAVGTSSDPDFDGVEQHGNVIPSFSNVFQTLVVEADKPGAAIDLTASQTRSSTRERQRVS